MLRASVLVLALLAASPALAQSQTYTAYDIQDALARAGYYRGPIDGSMGPGTRRAISSFQADNGLPVTGSPTNSMLGELRNRGLLAAAPSTGNSALVSDVQAALRNRGYTVPINGALDPQTRSAIRSFQREEGLPATGQPSAELLALIEGGRGGRNYARGNGDSLVRQIERRLANKGYDVGPIDGTLDSRTQYAIRTYQAQRGFAVSGAPSEQLLADLRTSTVTAQSARVPQTPEEAAGAVLRELGQQLQNQ